MAAAPITYRPADENLRQQICDRAAEQNISINEWLNRVALYGLTKGGTLTVTTTVEAKI